jgi:uncharacterized YccA/Bax inhibitor family protein
VRMPQTRTPQGARESRWDSSVRAYPLGRRDDITTTGITTAVVMVVAAISPNQAWRQPLLRLLDTVIGIAIGVMCKWIGSYLFFRGRPAV